MVVVVVVVVVTCDWDVRRNWLFKRREFLSAAERRNSKDRPDIFPIHNCLSVFFSRTTWNQICACRLSVVIICHVEQPTERSLGSKSDPVTTVGTDREWAW